jgi:hypothetical protein
MEITQQVRDYAAKLNETPEMAVEASQCLANTARPYFRSGKRASPKVQRHKARSRPRALPLLLLN